jgi:hypothetical protein
MNIQGRILQHAVAGKPPAWIAREMRLTVDDVQTVISQSKIPGSDGITDWNRALEQAKSSPWRKYK